MAQRMIAAILQARLSSSRLPGKVLKPILGKPMLARQIERVLRCEEIEKLVVATSVGEDDNAIADVCERLSVPYYRGNLNDVLDRYYQAASNLGADTVVRLTGDCPLADPQLIDSVIHQHLEEQNDYTSNTLDSTYPDGLDVEVFKFWALDDAWKQARLPSEREHVTPFIHGQPQRYKLANVASEKDLSELRWTVDEPADFEFVEKIYAALYPGNPAFDTRDILDLLQRKPELAKINTGFQRNEGLIKSQQQDTK